MQREELHPLLPQETPVLNLTISQTLSKIYTLLRGTQLDENNTFNLHPNEEAIQKALLEYKLTLPKDEKAARNFIINALRDVVLAVFTSLVTAYLRNDGTFSIANGLTVIGALVVATLFIIREVYDVRAEFIQNGGARQKTILDAQAYNKKAQGLVTDLDKAQADLTEARDVINRLKNERTELNERNQQLLLEADSLKTEVESLKQQVTENQTQIKEKIENVQEALNKVGQLESKMDAIADNVNKLAPLPEQINSLNTRLTTS